MPESNVLEECRIALEGFYIYSENLLCCASDLDQNDPIITSYIPKYVAEWWKITRSTKEKIAAVAPFMNNANGAAMDLWTVKLLLAVNRYADAMYLSAIPDFNWKLIQTRSVCETIRHFFTAEAMSPIQVAIRQLQASIDAGLGVHPNEKEMGNGDEPGKKRGKKPGRPTGTLKSDLPKDAKLYGDWKNSGMSIEEFSRARGIGFSSVQMAIWRHKKRLSIEK